MQKYDGNGTPLVADIDALHDNVAAEIAVLTEKVTPVAGDHILIEDSAAANVKKRVQVGNLPAPALGDNSVTDAKLRDSAATSVIGRSAGTIGDPADIAASADGQVLRRAAGALGFGAVDLADADAITGALPIGNGGTGQAGATAAFDALAPTTSAGDLLYHNGTDNIRLAGGSTTEKQVLQSDATPAPAWTTIIYEKSLTIETPTDTEDITLWHTDEKIEVIEVRGVLQGGAVTTVTCDVKWAADRSAAGTSVLSAAAAVTSTTTGNALTLHGTAANKQPTADTYIWLETSSGGGTGTINITIKYKRIF